MRKLLIAGALAAAAAEPVLAKDLLVTIARPQNLYVFDAKAREVVSDCDLGVNAMPGVIAMSPDGKIAYALVNRWQDVIGVDIMSCERVFYASQSTEKVTRRSLASLAVSKDGTEIYTIRNPVRKLADRYEVMESEFAVFAADGGLNAQPIRMFPAQRRSSVMATDAAGAVYVGGHDIYAIDPETGAQSLAIANANWERPTYGTPDVLAFWPVGSQNHEFLLLYSAPVFADETQQEMTDFIWGYSTVDLETGATEMRDFASFEVIMFSAARNPVAPNELFGVYTQLSKHDVDTGELIKRVDLPHTYYVVNVATDGSEIYVGGTNDDIGVYDPDTLERIGEMRVASGGDMAVATVHVVQAE